MVIHDMRNPTNYIDYALKEIINILSLEDPENDNTGSLKNKYH